MHSAHSIYYRCCVFAKVEREKGRKIKKEKERERQGEKKIHKRHDN